MNFLTYSIKNLLGVSGGISSDMRTLLQSNHKDAKLAIDLFVYKVSTWIGTMAAELQGIDALIFTAGIGENSSEIRKRICDKAAWLGIQLDKERNEKGKIVIHNMNSKIPVYVIPTDEEYVIAKHTYEHLNMLG